MIERVEERFDLKPRRLVGEAERYDRDLRDIFSVQDEIATSVAGVIEPALADAEQQRVLRKPTERLDAWEAYQRGLWHFFACLPPRYVRLICSITMCGPHQKYLTLSVVRFSS